MFSKIIGKTKQYIAVLFRKRINRIMLEQLLNTDFTILSSNCIGGVITHDLGKQFLSPTVNLYFSALDFVKFLEKLPYYIACPLVLKENNKNNYPIGLLEDIELHFVHYKNFEECLEKWNTRKKRINFKNLFCIMTDRDGCNDELIYRFSKIPYKKILFSCVPILKYGFICYIPGFKKNGCVGDLNKFADFKGNRYYEKYFKFIDWLNGD